MYGVAQNRPCEVGLRELTFKNGRFGPNPIDVPINCPKFLLNVEYLKISQILADYILRGSMILPRVRNPVWPILGGYFMYLG